MKHLALIALLPAACVAGQRTGTPAAVNETDRGPVSEADRARLAGISRLGREVYEQDTACALASDAFAAEWKGEQREVRGWIARRAEDGHVVTFLGGTPEEPLVLADVKVVAGEREVALRPTRALAAEERSVWSARQRALAKARTECTGAVNPVVIPVSGGGWDVFLLAATTKAEAVVGGHRRVRVTPDGLNIVEVEDFSRTCLTMPIEDRGAALVVTHLVSDLPAPTHVFVSLLHRRPVYVAAGNRVWLVRGDEIQRVK